jgi:hypothetical protein
MRFTTALFASFTVLSAAHPSPIHLEERVDNPDPKSVYIAGKFMSSFFKLC